MATIEVQNSYYDTKRLFINYGPVSRGVVQQSCLAALQKADKNSDNFVSPDETNESSSLTRSLATCGLTHSMVTLYQSDSLEGAKRQAMLSYKQDQLSLIRTLCITIGAFNLFICGLLVRAISTDPDFFSVKRCSRISLTLGAVTLLAFDVAGGLYCSKQVAGIKQKIASSTASRKEVPK